jgi:Pentapeptide repeats (8 copies)
MTNQGHLELLCQGRDVWYKWRIQHLEAKPDLSRANLSGADLSGANLWGANLSGANLSEANLSRTLLIGTNLTEATLTDCTIYGIAAWNVQLENAIQKNLIITQVDEATITVDNLKVAQFIYLMLNNKEIRDVINTLTTKSVLILGRFTPERKAILDALRDALRTYNYLPILFDFEKPSHLDLTETVTTLAHLSHFTIIDFSDPKSSAHEAASIIPHCKVAIQPIIEGLSNPYAMFTDFKLYPWVMNLYRYSDKNMLVTSLKEHIIEPAERKAEELERLKKNT